MMKMRGFTLVELAIVLVIIGILLTMGLQNMGALYEQKHRQTSEARLEQAQSALLNFVRVNGYLPCPAEDLSGDEARVLTGIILGDGGSGNTGSDSASGDDDRDDDQRGYGGHGEIYQYGTNARHGQMTGGASGNAAGGVLQDDSNTNTVSNEEIAVCKASRGMLPWRVLGLTQAQALDGYGQPLSYMVNGDVTETARICDPAASASYFCNSRAVFDLTTPPTASTQDAANLMVKYHSDHNKVLAEQLSIVIVAHNQRACGTEGLSADEAANCTNQPMPGVGAEYYGHGYDDIFDDQYVTFHGNEIKAAVGF